MKWRTIIFGIIIIICIVSINFGIYWMVTQDDITIDTDKEVALDTEAIANKFNSIFDNTIDYQDYTTSGIAKNDNTQELVYTKTQVKESIDGKYEINVNIPASNISTLMADNINEQIEQTFYSKVSSLKSNVQDIALNQQNIRK